MTTYLRFRGLVMNTVAGESVSHLITHPHCWSGLSDSTVFRNFASLQMCVPDVFPGVLLDGPRGLTPRWTLSWLLCCVSYCVPCRFHGCVPTLTAAVLMSLCIVPGCVLCYVSLVCSLYWSPCTLFRPCNRPWLAPDLLVIKGGGTKITSQLSIHRTTISLLQSTRKIKVDLYQAG